MLNLSLKVRKRVESVFCSAASRSTIHYGTQLTKVASNESQRFECGTFDNNNIFNASLEALNMLLIIIIIYLFI